MAGYIGNKAVGLNVTTGDILGDVGVGGDLTANGGAVFNEGSADVDFRIESNGSSHMFFVDGGDDQVRIARSADVDGFNLVVGTTTAAGAIAVIGRADDISQVIFYEADASTTIGKIDARNSLFNIGAVANVPVGIIVNNSQMATFGANHLTIGDGNLIIGTAGHGIDFSATGDGAGTDTSELLDDYEEGTFTPAFTTTNTGFSNIGYSHQNGFYTKVGRKVSIHIQLIVNTTPSGANGNLLISGLPYAGAANVQHGPGGISFYNNLTSQTNQASAMVYLEASSTNLNVCFQEFNGASAFTLTASTVLHNANPRLTCQMDYFV